MVGSLDGMPSVDDDGGEVGAVGGEEVDGGDDGLSVVGGGGGLEGGVGLEESG